MGSIPTTSTNKLKAAFLAAFSVFSVITLEEAPIIVSIGTPLNDGE